MSIQTGEQPAGPGASETAASATNGAPGGYEGVGHSLRVVRERRGLELADVSARLRIRRHYLEAIETGRFGELPGAVYINGFLRQYAEFLGLDPDQVLKTYQTEADAPLQRPVLNFPMPRPEDRTPRLWLVLGALVIAVAIYALWYRHQETLRLGQDLIRSVPAHLADLVPNPTPIRPAPGPAAAPPAAPAAAASAPAVPPAVASAPAVPPAVASTPVPPVVVATTTPAPADAPAPAAAAPAALSPATPSATPSPAAAVPAAAPSAPAAPVVAAAATPAPADPPAPAAGPPAAPAAEAPAAAANPASPGPAVFGAQGAANARIRLEATALAWIQVRGPNNEQVFTRLLHAGERYVVPPDRAGLVLLTGNAGGLRIVVDGRTLPPLGGDGEVRRGIPLDADQLKTAEGSQG